jgi:hypothetical protein
MCAQLTHLENAKEKATKEAGTIIGKFNNTYDEIQDYTVNALVSIVMFSFFLIIYSVMRTISRQLKAGKLFPSEVIAI